MVGGVIVYGLVMFLVVRPTVCRWARKQVRKQGGELSLNTLAILLIMIFVSASITNLIGIFSIFGGFAMGAILFDEHEVREAILARLHDFVEIGRAHV